MLDAALGVLVAVEKRREIYFVEVSDVDVPGDPEAAARARSRENVKVHLDTVTGLGAFVEIEAIDLDGSLGPALLEAQCRRLMVYLGIVEATWWRPPTATCSSSAQPCRGEPLARPRSDV